jgi:acyl-CoA thioesterase
MTTSPPTANPASDPLADGDALADLALTADGERPGRYHGTVTDSWRIFQAFGGVTFAMAPRAALEHLGREDLDPIAASAVYCAPVPPGPVTIDVEVLRDGRSAAQVGADLRVVGREGTALRLQATFGQAQDHGLAFTDTAFPTEAGAPDEWDPPPPRPTDDPFADLPFHRQTDWRPCIGHPPWDQTFPPGPARAGAWTRLLRPPIHPDGRFDPIGLCIHGDSIGSAMGQAIGSAQDFFVLTLELSLRFVRAQRSPWVLQHMRAWEATAGYGCGTTELWDSDHRLLAIANQVAKLRPIAKGEKL